MKRRGRGRREEEMKGGGRVPEKGGGGFRDYDDSGCSWREKRKQKGRGEEGG